MQVTHFWNKLYICWPKAVIILLSLILSYKASAQGNFLINNPSYDNKKFSYGFLIGLHNTAYQLRYSDAFISNNLDTLHSILPSKSPGFSLGFIVNMRLQEFFDLRITPKVAFYEHTLQYNYTNESAVSILKESTFVEFPLLLKYKSKRRGNIRMYMIGGVKPGFEASGRNDLESSIETLNVQRFNTTLEAGVGFDLYFPLFKFSPELRFSKGIMNVLSDDPSFYGQGIGRLNTNTIHFYMLFQ